jgi:hypothetical protein
MASSLRTPRPKAAVLRRRSPRSSGSGVEAPPLRFFPLERLRPHGRRFHRPPPLLGRPAYGPRRIPATRLAGANGSGARSTSGERAA